MQKYDRIHQYFINLDWRDQWNIKVLIYVWKYSHFRFSSKLLKFCSKKQVRDKTCRFIRYWLFEDQKDALKSIRKFIVANFDSSIYGSIVPKTKTLHLALGKENGTFTTANAINRVFWLLVLHSTWKKFVPQRFLQRETACQKPFLDKMFQILSP